MMMMNIIIIWWLRGFGNPPKRSVFLFSFLFVSNFKNLIHLINLILTKNKNKNKKNRNDNDNNDGDEDDDDGDDDADNDNDDVRNRVSSIKTTQLPIQTKVTQNQIKVNQTNNNNTYLSQ